MTGQQRAARTVARANQRAHERWQAYPVAVDGLVDVWLQNGEYVSGVALRSAPFQRDGQWLVTVAGMGDHMLERVRAHVVLA